MTIERFRKALDAARRASEEREDVYGTIGRVNENGSVSVLVAGRPRYYHVTLNGTQGATIALAHNTPRASGLPVRMRYERGELVIVGVNELALEAFLQGNTGGGAYNVAYHTHNTYSGLEYEVEAQHLQPGRVRFVSGLTVHINAFHYHHAGARQYWPGGDIDLTAVKPATAGTWAWVVVGVDPVTNTAVAVAGTAQSTGTPLTLDLIAGVAFTGYIPCGAVRVRADDTALGTIDRYADARIWFGDYELLALADLDGVTITTPANGQVLTFDGAGWVNAAAPGDVAASIVAAAEKTTPVDADLVGIVDSAAANVLKKLSWANIKATLQTAFNSVYATLSGGNTFTGVQVISGAGNRIDFTGTLGGGSEGVTYADTGAGVRYGLLFPGGDVVALANRAANGVVQVRANTASAGGGGEKVVAQFEDNIVTFNEAIRSGTFDLSDDTAMSFASPVLAGMIIIYARGGQQAKRSFSGGAVFQTGQGPVILFNGGNLEASASALSGTTGTDVKFTFGYNGGNIYLENRSGSVYSGSYLILG